MFKNVSDDTSDHRATNPPAQELGGLDVDGGPEQGLCHVINIHCQVRPKL